MCVCVCMRVRVYVCVCVYVCACVCMPACMCTGVHVSIETIKFTKIKRRQTKPITSLDKQN